MAITEIKPVGMRSSELFTSFAETGWGGVDWNPRANGAVRARIAALGSYMKEIAQEGPAAQDFIGITSLHNEAHIRMQRTKHPERISVTSIEPSGPQSAEVRVDRLTKTLFKMSDRPKLGKGVLSMVEHIETFVRATHEAKKVKRG